MRIRALDLGAYGPFTAKTLQLDGSFHLIYGPNEAGKSSALRALSDALFGIPAKTPDDFVHPYSALRIGLSLRSSHRELSFIRRKGTVRTLRLADETLLDDDHLRTFLNGVDRTTFLSMFGINHDSLVRGGDELAKGKGDIGQTLFAAGAGLSGVRQLEAELQTRASALFKPSGQNPAINKALSALKLGKADLRDAQLSATDWRDTDRDLDGVRREIAGTEARAERACRDRERLKRIHAALPSIGVRRTALAQLEQARCAPLLRAGFRDELLSCEEALKSARAAERDALDALSAIGDIPEPVLAGAKLIEDLYAQIGVAAKSASDCLRKKGELAQCLREAGEILRGLPDAPSIDRGHELIPDVATLAKIRNLIARDKDLGTGLHSASAQVELLDRQIHLAENSLAALEDVPDTAELERAIARARELGTSEKSYKQAVTAAQRLAGQIEVDLRTLPFWSGAPEALECLAVPPIETMHLYQAKLAGSDAELARASETLERVTAQLAAARQRLEALEQSAAVPAECDLESTRSGRDSLWREIKQAWHSGVPDAAGLSLSFEASVARADDLADRLRAAADQVRRRSALTLEIGNLEQQLAASQSHTAEVESARTALIAEWQSLWTGIQPRTPAEMLGWQTRRAAVCDRIRQLREQRAAIAAIDSEHAILAANLRNCLAERQRAAVRDSAFPALLAYCEGLVKIAHEKRSQREQLLASVTALRAQREETVVRVEDAEARRAAWRTEWSAAVARLRLAPDSNTEEAEAVLEAIRELDACLRSAAQLRDRIGKMERDARAFAEGVASVVAQTSPELRELPPAAGITRLHHLLQQAREAATRRDGHSRQLESARVAIRRAEAALATLCNEARCADANALPKLVEMSGTRAALEREVSELEQRLLLLASGRTVDEFVAEACAIDADSIPGQLEQLERELSELKSAREALDEQAAALRSRAASMAGGTEAAEVAENVAGVQAVLASNVAEYMKLRAALFVLRKAIERYREKHQGPVLGRAGQIFAAITADNFRGVQLDWAESGDPVLVGVRSSGATVTIAGMSEGTRDQLYLALRIASLENYAATHEPMPFIVDDILVNFDNERAAATLRVLAELSSKTQVIFFTHHQHIVDLAHAHVGASALSVRCLN